MFIQGGKCWCHLKVLDQNICEQNMRTVCSIDQMLQVRFIVYGRTSNSKDNEQMATQTFSNITPIQAQFMATFKER